MEMNREAGSKKPFECVTVFTDPLALTVDSSLKVLSQSTEVSTFDLLFLFF